jgi:hypothetical protein
MSLLTQKIESRFRQGARWGYVAKGIIYLVVGIVAALTAIGSRKAPVDSRGAVRQLFQQTHSEMLLWTLCAALAFYAVWRFFQAFTGRIPNHAHARWWRRAHMAISGSIHASFAFWIGKFLLQDPGPSSEIKTHATSQTVFHHAHGDILVLSVGIGVVIAGVYQFYRCYRGRVREDLDVTALSQRAADALVVCGRAGEAARGVVLSMIGGTMIAAALQTDPNRVRGFAGVLQQLRHQPAGQAMLLAASIGFFGLGIFLIFSARYQKL